MKDIDFDELDRAVSSVLGQSAKSGDEKPTGDAVDNSASSYDEGLKAVDDTGTDSTASQPAVQKDQEQNNAVAEPSKPATTPLAIKRRGKFMDVMHPSADMKPSGNTAPKPALPRPVITPLLTEEAESSVEHPSEPTAVVDESQSLIGAEPAPVETSSFETSPEASGEETPSDSSKALDSSAADDGDANSLPMAALTPQEGAPGSFITTDPQQDTHPEPSETPETPDDTSDMSGNIGQPTPFLSDTQVEKRPLGAFGDAEVTTGAAEETAAEVSSAPVDAQATPVMSLPRELQPDVVGVESVQENEAIEAPAGSSNPFAAKVAVAPEANDGRVEGHPLFDTSSYHEPIAAVHHGAFPGWAKWLIGLLVCLAIGAGVGYFLFTTGL